MLSRSSIMYVVYSILYRIILRLTTYKGCASVQSVNHLLTMLKTLTVFVAAVCAANAWLAFPVPALKLLKFHNPEGCYIAELDQVIPFNSMASSKSSCMGYHCFRDHMIYDRCGTTADLQKGCKLVNDDTISDPYPACCPIIE